MNESEPMEYLAAMRHLSRLGLSSMHCFSLVQGRRHQTPPTWRQASSDMPRVYGAGFWQVLPQVNCGARGLGGWVGRCLVRCEHSCQINAMRKETEENSNNTVIDDSCYRSSSSCSTHPLAKVLPDVDIIKTAASRHVFGPPFVLSSVRVGCHRLSD